MTRKILFTLLAALCLQTYAQTSLVSSQALYIYNFLRYIKWPDSRTSDKIIISVYGEDPIYDELVKLTRNRKVGQQSIVVKIATRPEELRNCHLAYVPMEKSGSIKAIRAAVGNRPTLIVSEKEGTNTQGSTIEFLRSEDKLHFKINQEAAKVQNFTISHELINMSKL